MEYCKQNKIKVNVSKIDNYVQRMQQPLISNELKEDFKKIIYDHAKHFTKNKFNNASRKLAKLAKIRKKSLKEI